MGDTGYAGEYVRFYDFLMQSSSRNDVPFYLEKARAVDGPVLELACGTGRIYLELLDEGFDVDGIDLSSDALALLHDRATTLDREPAVWQGDMAEFATERTYDLIYCPFNAIQNLLTIDDIRSTFECVYDSLAADGQFTFDVFVPSFEVICATYGEWTNTDVRYQGTTHTYRTRTRLVHEVEQLFVVDDELLDQHGEPVATTEHRLKMLPKREVELVAHLSPFSDWEVTGDFGEESISDGDSIQTWTLTK